MKTTYEETAIKSALATAKLAFEQKLSELRQQGSTIDAHVPFAKQTLVDFFTVARVNDYAIKPEALSSLMRCKEGHPSTQALKRGFRVGLEDLGLEAKF